jgi:hypothetical protein
MAMVMVMEHGQNTKTIITSILKIMITIQDRDKGTFIRITAMSLHLLLAILIIITIIAITSIIIIIIIAMITICQI